jgi:hypothetical protein
MASQSGSPGLTIPSPYQALPGLQPGESAIAAMSRAALPANQVITGPAEVGLGAGTNGFGATAPTLLATLAACGNNGTASLPGANAPDASPNIGSPNNGPAGNVMNGANPGATSELQNTVPANGAVQGLSTPALVASGALTLASGVFGG